MYIIMYKDGVYASFDAATSTPEFITAMRTVCGWTYIETRSYRQLHNDTAHIIMGSIILL